MSEPKPCIRCKSAPRAAGIRMGYCVDCKRKVGQAWYARQPKPARVPLAEQPCSRCKVSPRVSKSYCAECRRQYFRAWRERSSGKPYVERPAYGLVCAIPTCPKPQFKRGWCSVHYSRWSKNGHPLRLLRAERAALRRAARCSVDGCGDSLYKRDFCRRHYERWRKHGSVDTVLVGQPRRETAGYGSAHGRIRRDRGSAATYACAFHCGQSADQWAYNHADPDPDERVSEGYRYSLDPQRYIPLCRICHKAFDNAERQRIFRAGFALLVAGELSHEPVARVEDLTGEHLKNPIS